MIKRWFWTLVFQSRVRRWGTETACMELFEQFKEIRAPFVGDAPPFKVYAPNQWQFKEAERLAVIARAWFDQARSVAEAEVAAGLVDPPPPDRQAWIDGSGPHVASRRPSLMTHRVRVFVSIATKAAAFGFTTEVDVEDPMTVDGLEATARAVDRYNEWFKLYGFEYHKTYRHVPVDDYGLPQHAHYEHIVIDGGNLISFEHHLDLDAYRAEHGMDPERCEVCEGNVVPGKACSECGLTGPAGAGVPFDPTGGSGQVKRVEVTDPQGEARTLEVWGEAGGRTHAQDVLCRGVVGHGDSEAEAVADLWVKLDVPLRLDE